MVAFILGLLFITIVIFLLIYYIKILKKGKYAIGKICGISNGTIYHSGATAYFIEVQINKDGQDIKFDTLNMFCLIPFFEKYKLARLRKKHIGRQVHIYYNPNNQRQVLLKEYMWKEFLLCAFLLFLGIMLISVGIYILGTGNL